MKGRVCRVRLVRGNPSYRVVLDYPLAKKAHIKPKGTICQLVASPGQSLESLRRNFGVNMASSHEIPLSQVTWPRQLQKP